MGQVHCAPFKLSELNLVITDQIGYRMQIFEVYIFTKGNYDGTLNLL